MVTKWESLLSKSQFSIERTKYCDVEFVISQVIGDTRWASRYVLSRRFASDELVFYMALDRFLDEFDRTVSHAQGEL